MRLSLDAPVGKPSLSLRQDQIDTAADLLCQGATDARKLVHSEMHEVPISQLVIKSMRRLKKGLRLSNLEVTSEYELLDLDEENPEIKGRIDITFKFAHQFGDEDAYLAVECKRVSPNQTSWSGKYVTQGVDRFAEGQYSDGHYWGMMLGYVLHTPMGDLVDKISNRILLKYGVDAKLQPCPAHPNSLCMRVGAIPQGNQGHKIRLLHIFVDMTYRSVPDKL